LTFSHTVDDDLRVVLLVMSYLILVCCTTEPRLLTI